MANLIQQVIRICNRLAPFGWGTLLKRHGLNIEAQNLEVELYKDLSQTIDRNISGFEDFISSGRRAIEPYIPCKSLLFHAFASPNVHPGPSNSPIDKKDAYPTIEELDILENFIFSIEHDKSGVAIRDQLFFTTNFIKDNIIVAVFAYQYRPGARTVNGKYADFAYSRTGVSRVGTTEYCYVPSKRTFWTIPDSGDDKIPVLPARYGVFLAERRKANRKDDVLLNPNDNRDYIFPLHKLFSGDNCIRNLMIPSFEFKENHLSEKLKRAFTFIDGQANGFDLNQPPFNISSKLHGGLVSFERKGASSILVPNFTKKLVEFAKQKGKFVSFRVPPDDGTNRFATSYQMPSEGGRTRLGPEYLNIRFELLPDKSIQNISVQFPANKHADFLRKVKNGGYEAVQFIDGTCDGCIESEFQSEFTLTDKLLPAYSLVTAPDFFPLCDQIEIITWLNDNGLSSNEHFRQGGPDPLFDQRRLVNPFIQLPSSNAPAFSISADPTTLTAIVSMSVFTSSNPVIQKDHNQVSFLPDAASGFFAPGWDISLVFDRTINATFLSSSGLGSPFPEDSKLCAALNSFWPAVAPDASQTFIDSKGAGIVPTAFPMLNSELGYHPKHPLVTIGQKLSSLGWDGEQGSFFEGNFEFVNFTSIERSDYTANALEGKISLKQLCLVGAREWIRRMTVLRNCIAILPPPTDTVPKPGNLRLVSVEKINDWTSAQDKADVRLVGEGYIFQFAAIQGNEQLTDEVKRRRWAVDKSFTCHISDTFIFWKDNATGSFNAVRRASIPIK
jgi:hypothetical protein